MNNDTLRTEMTELRDTVHAGFARMDRYFELQQAQHLQLRGEVQDLRGEVGELRTLLVALTARVNAIEETVDRLENEVRALRDWVTREFADVRRELRLLRQAADDRDEGLRRDVDALDARVTRLEQRWDDSPA